MLARRAVLITGGLGFIGLHTARAILDLDDQTDCVLTQYRTTREPPFIRDQLGTRVFVEQLDVTDKTRLAEIGEEHSITDIVHLAVPTFGGLSPVDDLRVNVLGLLNILEAADRWRVRRLSVASSAAVYRGLTASPRREDTWLPLSGESPTETYKKVFEILAGHYADRAELDLVNLRISTVWGPLYHSMRNYPSRAVHAAVRGVPPTDGASGPDYAEDGGDLCYVKDCARGIALLQLADRLQHRTYNVGSGRVTTNGHIVAAIKRAIPSAELPLKDGRDEASGDPACLDITRLRQDTGYEVTYGTEEGVADYIAWLRSGSQE
jgi:UDP-glucose 4-epimerase